MVPAWVAGTVAEEVKDAKAPGWRPDPTGRFVGRFWNGTGWTEHVVSKERVTSTDPMPVPPADAPARPPAAVPRTGTGSRSLRDWPRWARIALPVAVLVAVVMAIALTSGGNDDAPSATPGTGAAPATKALYATGETAPTGDFDVTVYGARDPQEPGEFLKPQPGMHFVSVDVQVANRSSRQRPFSSQLGFHLLDPADHEFDTTFGETTPQPPDGDVPPGQSLRGFVVFEIPDGTTGLRLRVQGSLTAPAVTFALS
jgi:hypothetical protein